MSRRFLSFTVAFFAICVSLSQVSHAQLTGGGLGLGGLLGQSRSVGGVSVNPDGVLKNVDPAERKQLAELHAKAIQKVPVELNNGTPLRMISLRGIQDTIIEHQKAKKPLPEELLVLAGIQRIQYVFLDEVNKDIIIAGPADGWKVDAQGNLVGATNNRPMLLLDDLIVAMRAIDAARRGGITCSIDPTKEAIANAQKIFANKAGITANQSEQFAKSLETAMGDQVISVTGVPHDSHFAQILVASDYRMKRLGMKFDPSPIKGFVSYLDMFSPAESPAPRWFLAPNYQPLGRDKDGLAWELTGTGVKCMTEEDHFNEAGEKTGTKQATGGSAKKWADKMTEKYAELAAAEPIFAQLQGCMDMAVVAALIKQERFEDRAQLDLSYLFDEKALPHASYNVPKTVPTIAKVVRRNNRAVISASGGVAFQPWEAVQSKNTSTKDLATAKATATAKRKTAWWWN
jgi:hypothetical protein